MKEFFKDFLDEFKAFISKGNVLGLAIGIIIGNAFNTIVNSLINDIFMPVFGRLLSGVSFESWYIPLNGQKYDSYAAAKAADAPMITIGNFISAIIYFFIVALVLFLIMKAFNKATEAAHIKDAEKTKKEPAPISDEVKLLTEIRDLLSKQKE